VCKPDAVATCCALQRARPVTASAAAGADAKITRLAALAPPTALPAQACLPGPALAMHEVHTRWPVRLPGCASAKGPSRGSQPSRAAFPGRPAARPDPTRCAWTYECQSYKIAGLQCSYGLAARPSGSLKPWHNPANCGRRAGRGGGGPAPLQRRPAPPPGCARSPLRGAARGCGMEGCRASGGGHPPGTSSQPNTAARHTKQPRLAAGYISLQPALRCAPPSGPDDARPDSCSG
jgi:hypothetical protein